MLRNLFFQNSVEFYLIIKLTLKNEKKTKKKKKKRRTNKHHIPMKTVSFMVYFNEKNSLKNIFFLIK